MNTGGPLLCIFLHGVAETCCSQVLMRRTIQRGPESATGYLVDEAHMTPLVDYTSVPPKAQGEPCIPRALFRTLLCIAALPIWPPDKDIGFKRDSTNWCIGRGYPCAGYRQVDSHAWPSPSSIHQKRFNASFISLGHLHHSLLPSTIWGQRNAISGREHPNFADMPHDTTKAHRMLFVMLTSTSLDCSSYRASGKIILKLFMHSIFLSTFASKPTITVLYVCHRRSAARKAHRGGFKIVRKSSR